MIHMVFADASLELVPKEIIFHPVVRKYKRRFNKKNNFLLDSSYHHSAMKNLTDWERRGRPDITHFCLLEALGSPLCRDGKLSVYVHTYENNLIEFDSRTRLPRNYDRFKGLIEEVFRDKKSKNELIVMKENVDLKDFFSIIGCKKIIGLSSKGEKTDIREAITKYSLEKNLGIVIGSFPKGDFSRDVMDPITDLIAIYPKPLDAWTVTSRVLCKMETIYGLI